MKFPDNNIQTSPVTCNKISNAQWIVDFTGYVYDPNIDDALQCLKNWYNKDNLYLKITHAFIDIPQVYGIEKYIDSSSVPNHYLITVKESYENKPCEEYVIGMYHTKERKLDAFALPEKVHIQVVIPEQAWRLQYVIQMDLLRTLVIILMFILQLNSFPLFFSHSTI